MTEKMPFQDLAFSLYLFITRLHAAALKSSANDLFFFSREGQILKLMFDTFQAQKANSNAIRTHYLKVSRRSSFLLSLGPLAEERFDILFRQYRRISICDFLKSLALEEHALFLANELCVDADSLEMQRDDLPTDPLFLALKSLEAFRLLYENERIARSKAFSQYVADFVGGNVPDKLFVVDVGWKGSIQDNLFNWLTRVRGESARVEGYYLGLVATGGLGSRNIKNGLLFSGVNELTEGFHIFNENRSLYEVLLHADHGSAQRYLLNSKNKVKVVEDDFKEQEMINKNIVQISRAVMALFGQLATTLANSRVTDRELLALALERHARMVFEPSREEINWMLSVSHVENFGVFVESRFGSEPCRHSFVRRIQFSWKLIRDRRLSEIGFWPWLVIEQNAISGFSSIYRWFRLSQSREKSPFYFGLFSSWVDCK